MSDLRYHEITTGTESEMVIVDLLLARMFGKGCYRISVNKSKTEYTAKFWATAEDFGTVVRYLENAALEMLNDQYFELLAES